MRSTGLEMAKNQGLDSVYQNKKIKIKNFERRQRRDMLTYRGGGGSAKGYKIKRFAKGYIFLKYVPICGVYREAPNEAPAGLLRGLLRGLLLHHYGGGAAATRGLLLRGCCCYGNKRSETGRAGCDPRTGNGCERSQITYNFHK